jgi:hypothetical protein
MNVNAKKRGNQDVNFFYMLTDSSLHGFWCPDIPKSLWDTNRTPQL